MSPNRSSAVMQQRHEALDSLDDFPTPPFSTRSLCERLSLDIETQTVWEPAANRGFMVRPLAERFGRVIGSDIHDYGAGFPLHDFAGGALGARDWQPPERVDWIITNPPFNKALEFLFQARKVASVGVCMFLRTSWLESEERYDEIFSRHDMRPAYWYQHVERVALLKGRCLRYGSTDPSTGKKVSTATSYGWAVWCESRSSETILRWIPPCRARLERPGDYDQDCATIGETDGAKTHEQWQGQGSLTEAASQG
jgi:hypothetical protein